MSEYLVVKVPEGALGSVRKNLHAFCKDQGITVSDFGTGFPLVEMSERFAISNIFVTVMQRARTVSDLCALSPRNNPVAQYERRTGRSVFDRRGR